MDLLKNPFYILFATTRDNRHRVMELEEEQGLLSDPDECRAARDTLINPRKRISAEVAWLPGIDPTLFDIVLNHLIVLDTLDSPNQNLLNITGLTPIARANLLITGVSRLPTLPASDIVEWILAIAQASETINSETVRAILNEDRRVSGFPEITDLSAIDDEIRKQKNCYRRVLTSILESLSVPERASVLTIAIETSTGNGSSQSPVLIKDLMPAYELSVQDSLEQYKRIIEAQDDRLRVMVDAENTDIAMQPIVDQLSEAVREWDTLAQPIQLSRRSTGQRHDASFEIAWRVQNLAIYLFTEYLQYDFSLQLLNMLLDVFAEVPEIVERITRDREDLESQRHEVEGIRRFTEINTQGETLQNASDRNEPDYTLTPMVNQLIQTVRSWNPSTQPVEANNAVANIVRNRAIHLWNEHQQLDFAIQITETLIEVFRGVDGMDEVNNQLREDIMALYAMRIQRRRASEQQQRGDTGCLLQIVIFAVIGVIVALLQAC